MTCPTCGRQINSRDPRRRYCSHACRQASYERRKRLVRDGVSSTGAPQEPSRDQGRGPLGRVLAGLLAAAPNPSRSRPPAPTGTSTLAGGAGWRSVWRRSVDRSRRPPPGPTARTSSLPPEPEPSTWRMAASCGTCPADTAAQTSCRSTATSMAAATSAAAGAPSSSTPRPGRSQTPWALGGWQRPHACSGGWGSPSLPSLRATLTVTSWRCPTS
jgi:hypothetical protein